MDQIPAVTVAPADPGAVRVATAAFRGLQRGAATGDWSGFTDLVTDDVRIMIPVPATVPNPPEGLLEGRATVEMLFGTHHAEEVAGARLEAKRVTANGHVVTFEARVEGDLDGETVANHFVFTFEVAGERIAAVYEYAMWTAEHETSRWTDVTFAREAFGTSVLPAGDQTAAGVD